MTKQEFREIVRKLKTAYSDPKFIPDQYAFDLWYSFFKDDTFEAVAKASVQYMANGKYAPTIADLRGLLATDELTEAEAWQLVIKAVRDSINNAEYEFERLPETVQKAVVSPGSLRHMATMDSDELHTVEKSHFMRMYRTEAERSRQKQALPERMQELIESAMPKLPG